MFDLGIVYHRFTGPSITRVWLRDGMVCDHYASSGHLDYIGTWSA